MQYLLLIYDQEKAFAKLSPDQISTVMKDYGEFTQGIVKSGHFRAGERLQSVSAATTVREVAGKPAFTDGPFAETKEQLGGYYLVECKNLDEATAIAARIPAVRIGGAVEVRPIFPMSGGAAAQ